MLWYFVLIGLLMVGNAVDEGKSLGAVFLIAVFIVVTLFLGRWEHRVWHLANKKRLEAMKEKLVEPV